MSPEQLDYILKSTEGVDLEFKEAKTNFDLTALNEYCMGISNANGGYLLLGVNDAGEIIGTTCFQKSIQDKLYRLHSNLGIDIEAYEVNHSKGRVVVFKIPEHYPGRPIEYKGRYKIRVGSSLSEMTPDQLRSIFYELEPDYTAEFCDGATLTDLDKQAISRLREMWAEKSGRNERLSKSNGQVLKELRLVSDGKITVAAIILVGTVEAVEKYLPNSEIIFEWRQNPARVPYDFRTNWRRPFIMAFDDVWDTINLRNSLFSIQQGFIQRTVWAFNEKVIREAIMNAVAHREYRLKSHSIWIKASTESLSVESPGGLAHGVTINNIFEKSVWRNRLLADTLRQIGLMEQSGQGIDDIFKISIGEGKSAPEIKTDGRSVKIDVPARVVDENFIRFLELFTQKNGDVLSVEEVMELEKVRTSGKISTLEFKDALIKKGLVEPAGHGRGTKYLLAKQYYQSVGKMGTYTKAKGLDNKSKRGLVMQHLDENKKITNEELCQMFPDLDYYQRYNLIRPFVKDKVIERVGGNKGAGYWKKIS